MTPSCAATCSKPPAKKPTTWPGRSSGSTPWAPGDHLAWTQQRLDALGARPSLLNPLWFAGAFALGLAAAKVSDRVSLGFVVETENQVAQHLQGHLARLPADDLASRAVVSRMKDDEERHAASARDAGAMALPAPARLMMKMAAKVMTTTAHYV